MVQTLTPLTQEHPFKTPPAKLNHTVSDKNTEVSGRCLDAVCYTEARGPWGGEEDVKQ